MGPFTSIVWEEENEELRLPENEEVSKEVWGTLGVVQEWELK